MYIEESFAVEATKKNKKDPRWPVYIEWLKGLENHTSVSFGDMERHNPFYGTTRGYQTGNWTRLQIAIEYTLDEVFSKYNIEMPESNLEKAKRLYPPGTRFMCISDECEGVVIDNPNYTVLPNGSIIVNEEGNRIYRKGLIFHHQSNQWAEIIPEKENNALGQKVEVGKWYKSIRGSDLFIRILSTDSGHLHGYGINSSGNWTESDSWYGLSLTVGVDLIEASKEEVFQRLKKFAISKGFVKGAVISAQSIDKVYYSHREIKSESFKLKNDYSLILGDCVDDEGRKEISSMILSKEGKWATVVREPVKEEGFEFNTEYRPGNHRIARPGQLAGRIFREVLPSEIELKSKDPYTFGIDSTGPEQNNSEKNPKLMKPLLLNPRNKKSKGVFLADTKDV